MPDHLRPAWEAFSEQAERVEKARQALLSCLPVGRVDPAPVPVGLDVLRDELTEIVGVMDAWKVDEVADPWQRCRAGVDEALAQIEPTREVAESTGELEELLDAVTDVVEPLDVWGEAERAWLKLRVRS
jgi:hypothetical protein